MQSSSSPGGLASFLLRSDHSRAPLCINNTSLPSLTGPDVESTPGLEEIEAEESTRDGSVFDALGGPSSPPSIIGGDGSLIRAADGLIFATHA